VLHPGMASELARLESEERSRSAAVSRPARTNIAEWRWSAAGAIGLLALVLIGPIATILALAGLVAVALVVSGRARGRPAAGPEALDRWSAWRVVEPDAAYRHRRAA
jgi:hypothetical protein